MRTCFRYRPAGIYGEHQHLADLSEPAELQPEVPVDDHERIEKLQEHVANYINADWIRISDCHF
ncbi:hypothetical protein ACLK1S_14305 [Escherichia coli]